MKKKYASPVLLLEDPGDFQDVGITIDPDPEENVNLSAAGHPHPEEDGEE